MQVGLDMFQVVGLPPGLARSLHLFRNIPTLAWPQLAPTASSALAWRTGGT